MNMTRFAGKETKKIELAGGDWVEVKSSLPYASFIQIFANVDQKETVKNMEMGLPLLKASVVAWNLKDEKGEDVPCTPENIELLDSPTVLELLEPVMKLYMPEKKS